MAIKLFIQKDGEDPRELDFDGPVVLIGRGDTNDLVIDDIRSSRKHCSVSETPQGVVLEDLESSNGTRFKGEPVKRTLLESGEEFQIGSTTFFYDSCAALSSPEPQAPPVADVEDLVLESDLPEPEDVSVEVASSLEELDPLEGSADAGQSEELTGDSAEQPGGVVLTLKQVVGELEEETTEVGSLPFSIGRSSGCDLTLNDQRASGRHAELLEKDGVLAVKDLGSKNGVLVDDRKVRQAGLLGDGSRFSVGSHTVSYTHLTLPTILLV